MSGTHNEDLSGGWDAIAERVAAGRASTTIGVAVLKQWARNLPSGAVVLDLGCGGGAPVSTTLVDAGAIVFGVDASPRMVAVYGRRFPTAQVACEAAQACTFFGRRFDAVAAVGLMFLMDESAQRAVVRGVADALAPGGRFLFAAPWQTGTWLDNDTGRESRSLGREAYTALLLEHGLHVVETFVDEGGNHYFSAAKGAAEK